MGILTSQGQLLCFAPCSLQSLLEQEDVLQDFQFNPYPVPRGFQSAEAAAQRGWGWCSMHTMGWKGQQTSPGCQQSAGAGCAGNPQGGCPGAAGSNSCSAQTLGCCQALAHPSCGTSTDSAFGKGKPSAEGTGHTAAPCPAPPVVLGTKRPQLPSQTNSISSGEQKAFLASLESLGAALPASPHHFPGWIPFSCPETIPVEPQHRTKVSGAKSVTCRAPAAGSWCF